MATVKDYVDYVERHSHLQMPKHCNTPFTTSYKPELDITPELPLQEFLLHVSHWDSKVAVKLGIVDICLETSIISSHITSPRVGHLHQVLHIFSYLDIP